MNLPPRWPLERPGLLDRVRGGSLQEMGEQSRSNTWTLQQDQREHVQLDRGCGKCRTYFFRQNLFPHLFLVARTGLGLGPWSDEPPFLLGFLENLGHYFTLFCSTILFSIVFALLFESQRPEHSAIFGVNRNRECDWEKEWKTSDLWPSKTTVKSI